MRVGIGFDIHRLVQTSEGSSIPIGGIKVPCSFTIQAHSDGDVLLHALTDACLGALGLGDIGQWFPDTDPANKNRDSREFVKLVLSEVRAKKCRIVHVDSVILLEKPKLAAHVHAIRQELATLLAVDISAVSVKAKTMEGLGPVGSAEAIAAYVVTTVESEV